MAIAVGCALVCLGVCLPLFFHYKTQRHALGAGFKGLGTLCALVPALISALKLNPVGWVFTAALALHAAGDVLLEYQFVPGMGCFLLGHICYIAAFLRLFPLTAAHLICTLALGAGCFWLLSRQKARIGKNMLPFACYAAVLCLSGGCAIAGGGSAGTVQGLMIALGGALFLFSDGLLFRNLLDPRGRGAELTIMITYYCAQLLLGCSCLLL